MTLEEKKARLVELKAKLAQMKENASVDAERGGLQAAAERLMVDDPIAAFGLLDKSRALDIKQQQAGRAASPDAARQQLRISRDIAIQAANNQTLDKTERALAAAEARVYIDEMAKPNPSTQAAAERVSALYGKALPPDPTSTPKGDPKTDMEAKIKGEIDSIQYKGRALDGKVASLNLAIDNADLDSGQKTSLKKYLSDMADTKPVAPASMDAKSQKWVDQYLAVLDPKALSTRATKAREALNALIAEFNNNNYSTANLKVFKEVMGAMSGGEYGIAANSTFAAVASALPLFGDAIASAIAVNKFNNKEDARARINDAIKSWNDFINGYSAENMYDKESGLSQTAVINAIKTNPKYSAMKSSLGAPIPILTQNRDEAAGKPLPGAAADKNGPKKGDTKMVGKVTMTYDGKVWR